MPNHQAAGTDAAHRQHYGITFALLAIAGISYALLQSLVAPALPELQHALHTSENSVSWVLTAYLLSASIATPLIGRLGDMYGKERLLMIVLVLLAVGTLVSAVSTTLAVMLVGRVIQGAAGGVFPLAFGIIRDEFPRAKVAGGIGLMSALLGVGGGVGVVLSGPIVDHLSYHYLFWLPLIPIVIATALIQVFVPESPIRVPGRDELGRHGSDVDRARRRADRRQRNGDLALALGEDDRPDRGRSRPARLLGPERVEIRPSARRHAHDADPRRLDDQHRRAPARLRDVLVVHRPAAIRRDARPMRATGSAAPSRRRASSSFPRR